jgi:hypothetical protein
MYQQNSIEKVFTFSFPSNHLLNVQLVHEISNNTKYVAEKIEYFCFMSLIPGANTGDGQNRTYDFKNSINLKFSLQEISGLAFVLNACAIGNGHVALPYTKFAKSSTGNKSVTIFEAAADQNKQYDFRKIIIKFDLISSKVKYALQLSPDQAYSVAKVLEKIFEKGISLEIEKQIQAPRETTGYTKQNNSETFSMPQPQPINNQISNGANAQVASLFSQF